MIHVENHGPLIISTNYWNTELAQRGKLFVSVNAGAIRILLPRSLYGMLDDMRTSRDVVLSRGPWLAMHLEEAVEFLFDDGSQSPFALHLSTECFDALPSEPSKGREWTVSIWIWKEGKPHKAMERICHWRRVERLPWLKAWKA